MIKGKILKYGPPFTEGFIEFLHLIDTAEVFLREKTGKASVNTDIANEIIFNNTTSTKQYENSLIRKFEFACEEIEMLINDTALKNEKINILNRFIIEVNSIRKALVRTNNGLRHSRFSFTNTLGKVPDSKNYSDDDFQEYYSWMDTFMDKAIDFLDLFKKNIELTAPDQFPKPFYLNPSPNDSTLENPIAAFDFLIVDKGIIHLRNTFFPLESSDHQEEILYDLQNEIKTIKERDQETFDWKEYKYSFKNVVVARVRKELEKSKRFIDKNVSDKIEKKDLLLYFEILMDHLEYLRNISENNTDFQRYCQPLNPIDELINYVHNKYPSFQLLHKSHFVDSAVSGVIRNPDDLKRSELKDNLSSSNPGAFNWARPEPERLSILLHNFLNNRFISNIDLDKFHLAFSGKHLPIPLEIKWIDKPPSNASVNKVSLLYLFKRLSEEKLIDTEYDSSEMDQKLTFIFVDNDGKRLENLVQSRVNVKSAKSKTHAKKAIDGIIKTLLHNLPSFLA